MIIVVILQCLLKVRINFLLHVVEIITYIPKIIKNFLKKCNWLNDYNQQGIML